MLCRAMAGEKGKQSSRKVRPRAGKRRKKRSLFILPNIEEDFEDDEFSFLDFPVQRSKSKMCESALVDVQTFSTILSDPAALELADAAPVCGGRRFHRVFSKRDFPVLGEEDGADEDETRQVWLSKHSRYPRNYSRMLVLTEILPVTLIKISLNQLQIQNITLKSKRWNVMYRKNAVLNPLPWQNGVSCRSQFNFIPRVGSCKWKKAFVYRRGGKGPLGPDFGPGPGNARLNVPDRSWRGP